MASKSTSNATSKRLRTLVPMRPARSNIAVDNSAPTAPTAHPAPAAAARGPCGFSAHAKVSAVAPATAIARGAHPMKAARVVAFRRMRNQKISKANTRPIVHPAKASRAPTTAEEARLAAAARPADSTAGKGRLMPGSAAPQDELPTQSSIETGGLPRREQSLAEAPEQATSLRRCPAPQVLEQAPQAPTDHSQPETSWQSTVMAVMFPAASVACRLLTPAPQRLEHRVHGDIHWQSSVAAQPCRSAGAGPRARQSSARAAASAPPPRQVTDRCCVPSPQRPEQADQSPISQ
mmetsp:Transcript_80526/g.232745  ORF Transcript_80526/g.232745 Transcript_80526/m.232745 type:complete len:292 (-) Transcript_80526:861-1736(-)